MNKTYLDHWKDGFWLYFSIFISSLPTTIPLWFLLRDGGENANEMHIFFVIFFGVVLGPGLFSYIFRMMDSPDSRETRAVNEMHCPQCQSTVNPMTRSGLHSPDDEPWKLICDRCNTEIEPHV